jgi:hypothetical protein
MISISSIVNIVEKNTRIVETNFVIQVDLETLDSRKSASCVKSPIVDQEISRKKSEISRQSDFQIVIVNVKFV